MEAQIKTEKKKPTSSTSSEKLNDKLSTRLSKELVIALCGPLGCGIKQIKLKLKECLEEQGYEVVDIRVSDLIKEAVRKSADEELKGLLPKSTASYAESIESMQILGNKLRAKSEPSIAAQLAIKEIATWREENKVEDQKPETLATKNNTIFIVDQLKNPEETKLLKKVYGSIFYQIGIISNESEKKARLMKLKVDESKASELIQVDRKENIAHGQQLEKTMTHSDYFISNNNANLPSIKNNLSRFLKLIHGVNGITPSKDEVGMYAAYSASLRSACLSRQVGAAICDVHGNVLAVGRNDVPKFGGGLYQPEDRDKDYRCIHHGGKCYNTEKIKSVADDIKDILSEYGVPPQDLEKAIKRIHSDTALGSLVEFSRAIHAEMDAILTLGRSTQGNTTGKVMYTTTYPCHNCARHIVAAGISKVIYIEPYEKSLAVSLHRDSITTNTNDKTRVCIQSFEGVSPTRYQRLFVAKGMRKDDTGHAISFKPQHMKHIEEVIIASYPDVERKVTEHLDTALTSIDTSLNVTNIDN